MRNRLALSPRRAGLSVSVCGRGDGKVRSSGRVTELVCLLGADHGQLCGIKKADLHEERDLILENKELMVP
jgi:hypothetical protein